MKPDREKQNSIKQLIKYVKVTNTINFDGNILYIPEGKEQEIKKDLTSLSDMKFLAKWSITLMGFVFRGLDLCEDDFDKNRMLINKCLTICETFVFKTKDGGGVSWDFYGLYGKRNFIGIFEPSAQAKKLVKLLEDYVGKEEDINSLISRLYKET